MTLSEYVSRANILAGEAQVVGGVHGYYLLHRQRLWRTASHFDLWNLRNQRVLEIGPFYSYTPFLLQEQGNTVSVLEGEDPIVDPLKALYQQRGIEFISCELSRSFGSPARKDHRLPFPDAQFDRICCWETMEHFNFNPVGFVREIHRVLKPGGAAFLTVPNNASLNNRLKLLCGRSIATPVQSYAQYYGYADGVFLGFHWREYCLAEFAELFKTQQFHISSARHLLTFQQKEHTSPVQKLKRTLAAVSCGVVPSFGNICAITVTKQVA